MKKIALILLPIILVGCRNIQKDVHTVVTIEDKKTQITTVTETVDKSTDESFTLGLSEGDGKILDILDVNVSGVGK